MRYMRYCYERLLCVFQVQGHFLVGLVEFVDVRNGFSYAWMLSLWFSFRHCYPLFEQRNRQGIRSFTFVSEDI